MSAEQIEQALTSAPVAIDRVAVWSRSHVNMPAAWAQYLMLKVMPANALQCAHDLFAQLREFDVQGATQIWVETPPTETSWDGVRDRLTRAAAPF
jgi:L-threonylcarbamoyladenylate synthase